MSINNNIKCLENIKQRFKRTTSRNKYRSEITTQSKSNNLDYLIDPTSTSINRLFVLLFKNGNNDLTRIPFEKYHMPLVEVKDFNKLIDKKSILDQLVKTKKKSIEMSKNGDYTTGNLLDYLYHQNYYKLIGIDLSRQANANILKQIIFRGNLE